MPANPDRADVAQVGGLLAPPSNRPAGAVLADQIVTAIALGEFQPGQRLPPERELAETLGVSRATVRDALSRVAALDLLEVRRGRHGGAFIRSPWTTGSAEAVRAVLEPQWSALEQAMDTRLLLEALIARTAAERRTGEDVSVIETALIAYERADDLTDAQAADVALHHAVARAAHNQALLDLHERLLTQVSLGFAVEPFTRTIYERALPEHRALALAIVDGDELQAWDVGRAHFGISAEEMRSTLRRAVTDIAEA